MAAKRKTVLRGFTYMHCDDFAKYLSDMAAKGWHFKEWGVGLKFEEGEPKQAVYAVEVFPKASENDMRPEPKTQEFAEYCESAGWKFIDAKQKYCIFKKIDEDALDLFTHEERVMNAFKGTFSGSALALFFLVGLNALLRWDNLFDFFETAIFSSDFLFAFYIWHIMLIGQFLTFAHAFRMRMKLMRRIRSGKGVYIGNRQDGKFRLNGNDINNLILIIFLMCYFLAMDRIGFIIFNLFIVAVVIGFAILLNKIRPDHDTNVIMQIGFSVILIFTIVTSVVIGVFGDRTDLDVNKDHVPMYITDYREIQDEVSDISYYHEENAFGSSDKYFVYGENESIHYYIYKSRFTGVLDKVWEDIISNRKYNEDAVDCTEDWEANLAVRNKIGTYYVRYDNVILEFSDYEDLYLSKEQINIILDKLEIK